MYFILTWDLVDFRVGLGQCNCRRPVELLNDQVFPVKYRSTQINLIKSKLDTFKLATLRELIVTSAGKIYGSVDYHEPIGRCGQ